MTEYPRLAEELTTRGVPHIRVVESSDRDRLEEIVRGAGNFSVEEIDTAMELIDDALLTRNDSDYLVHVLEDRGGIHGYVCIGPTPLARGVYDLYWIAVDATAHRRGYGRKLLAFAEQEVRRRGGRMLLIETSSLETYRSTREFYARSGYEEVARVPNFYNVGDDKLIYSKSF
ncbi:MAG TPA: GNAT family N-acetyltransferase [Thermoanaerobaculia bacterium]|nr:GNAT family N-acetyltransferase [Thermoanaerobaculia bacterium]